VASAGSTSAAGAQTATTERLGPTFAQRQHSYRACRERGNIPRRALENPVMHRHATALTARPRVRFVQPWWFGDPYFKSTGFELINLPPLVPTNKLVPPAPAPTSTRHGR
jgi:hypothetical protein